MIEGLHYYSPERCITNHPYLVSYALCHSYISLIAIMRLLLFPPCSLHVYMYEVQLMHTYDVASETSVNFGCSSKEAIGGYLMIVITRHYTTLCSIQLGFLMFMRKLCPTGSSVCISSVPFIIKNCVPWLLTKLYHCDI